MKKAEKIAILGFGKEGKAVYKFLKKQGIKNVSILDRKLDEGYLKHLKSFDIVYRSPGVPYNLKEIQTAIASGVKVSGCTELFFQNKKGLVIGVTGTKGKGTTSTLIYQMLKATGRDVYLAGNIGKPAVEILPKLKKNSITILELSSFQLQDLKYSPEIAVALNIFPDHMDAHKNFKEYVDAKANITRFQKRGNKVFYAADNKYSQNIARLSRGKLIPVDHNKFKIFSSAELKTPGDHNFKNAATAAMVAMSLGASKETVKRIAKQYKGLPYHLTLDGVIKGVKIYNDSSSTNPNTTAAAVLAFPNDNLNNVLIMGGSDKGLDYKPTAQALKKYPMKLVVLMGENSKKIAQAIKGNKYVFAKSLKEALKTALKNSAKGGSIIFSPGSASFDMFRDYYDRGEKFARLVKKGVNKYTG